jgi:hypothetical protein
LLFTFRIYTSSVFLVITICHAIAIENISVVIKNWE